MNSLEFIKTLPIGAKRYFFATLGEGENAVAVYEKPTANETALGGEKTTKTRSKSLSILIHWSRRADETRNAALKLYNLLKDVHNVTFADVRIAFVKLNNNEPIDVGTDKEGIFERIIDCKIYYERMD